MGPGPRAQDIVHRRRGGKGDERAAVCRHGGGGMGEGRHGWHGTKLWQPAWPPWGCRLPALAGGGKPARPHQRAHTVVELRIAAERGQVAGGVRRPSKVTQCKGQQQHPLTL